MRIATKIRIDNWFSSPSLEPTEIQSFEYSGPVDKLKGASKQETEINKAQTAFYDTLRKDYEQQFAKQGAIISAIDAVAAPIMKAGPGQYGYSTAEDTALRTQASEGTAQQYQNVKKALSSQVAAEGGGNEFLPSGAKVELDANIDTAAAESESEKQLGITQKGYDIGRQNYTQASEMEASAAGLTNPLGYAGSAESAGNEAFTGAKDIAQQNDAASPWGVIGGIVGGGLSAFSGGFGTSLGKKV